MRHTILQCTIKHILYPNKCFFPCPFEHCGLHTLKISCLESGQFLKSNVYIFPVKIDRLIDQANSRDDKKVRLCIALHRICIEKRNKMTIAHREKQFRSKSLNFALLIEVLYNVQLPTFTVRLTECSH